MSKLPDRCTYARLIRKSVVHTVTVFYIKDKSIGVLYVSLGHLGPHNGSFYLRRSMLLFRCVYYPLLVEQGHINLIYDHKEESLCTTPSKDMCSL
jgi:hypothetical protein